MKISLEWIGDYVTLPEGVTSRELAQQLTLKTVEVEGWAQAGTDTILEIDNKSLTNRPDLWGHHGLAREFAAIYHLPCADAVPEPRVARPEARSGLIGPVDPAVCKRIAVVEFELDDAPPTPEWLRSRLQRIGEPSVSLLTDLSNYVMYATGQPTQVHGAEAQAEAGARAGAVSTADDTSLTSASARYRLEAAALSPDAVRQTTQRTGVRTEATARYEKGLDTQRVDQAIDLFLTLLARCAPGARVLAMQDHNPQPTERAAVTVGLGYLAKRIGVPVSADEARATLTELGFTVRLDDNGNDLHTLAPTWRSTGDIAIPEDVLEEIARIHGYEAIPASPLGGTLAYRAPTQIRPLDRRVRESLAAHAGMQEVVTYPWSTDRILQAAGHDPARGVAMQDPPSPDTATLRPSLVPNLLEAVANNLRYRTQLSIFEVGAVFDGDGDGDGCSDDRNRNDGMGAVASPHAPVIAQRAALMLVGTTTEGPDLFLRAKGVVELLARSCGISGLALIPPSPDATTPIPGWADHATRLTIAITAPAPAHSDPTSHHDPDPHSVPHAQPVPHCLPVGTLALLTPRCRRLAGIPDTQVACLELDLDTLAPSLSPTRENTYRPVPEWPESDFDLSVVLPEYTLWQHIAEAAKSADAPVDRIAYVGEFRGAWVPEAHKSTTLRVTLRPTTATLTPEDLATARTRVLDALRTRLAARLRE